MTYRSFILLGACLWFGVCLGAAETAPEVAWGPEVDGLQAGLALTNPAKLIYGTGESLTLKCLIRNNTKTAVKLSFSEQSFGLNPLVLDQHGRKATVLLAPRTRPLGMRTIAPGESTDLRIARLQIRPPALVRDMLSPPSTTGWNRLEAALPATAGLYTLCESGSFALKGTAECVGTLTTGTVRFEIHAFDPDAITKAAADELKYQTDQLDIALSVRGGPAYRPLRLQSTAVGQASCLSSDRRDACPTALLSSEQVEKLVDHLADRDYFWDAISAAPLLEDAERPCCVLTVRGHIADTACGEVEYVETLGWGADLLQSLSAFRSALDGAAAKAMDDWLKQFDAERKQWQPKTATPEVF